MRTIVLLRLLTTGLEIRRPTLIYERLLFLFREKNVVRSSCALFKGLGKFKRLLRPEHAHAAKFP